VKAPLQPRISVPMQGGLGRLSLAALGVVFGDIGTSPLYTLRACTMGNHGFRATHEDVLGILSLVFWALTVVVSVKYIGFIMKADNDGEGGIFALLALIPQRLRNRPAAGLGWAAILVIVGASLILGDGMITPAISVLSAIEGLEIAAPRLAPAVIPLTCIVLLGLFTIQSRGTGSVGRLFGPVMIVWFSVIAILGVVQITQYPAVLWALSPHHAIRFFTVHGWRGFLVLGSVVLAITGGEALYADMGHLGRRPIRVAWFVIAMPSLVLNYFGQGALLLTTSSVSHPFFAMVPPGALTYALVLLASMATVIASQALISGAFSLTYQAVQLGFFPRITVKHTSSATEGQIYIPEINWGLATASIVLVLVFGASSRLASAYGIAVTGTMAITSIIFFEVTRTRWNWSLWRALPLLILFLSFDLPFFASNLFKFGDGGYVPILVGAAIFAVMVTWKYGRLVYAEHLESVAVALDTFLATLHERCSMRVPVAGVFLTANQSSVPRIIHNLVNRMRCLPATVILLTVKILHVPYVAADNLVVQELGQGFYRLTVSFGFMDDSDVPRAFGRAVERYGLAVDPSTVVYYIALDRFMAAPGGRMGRWREALFAYLYRNAKSATFQFRIPAEQVVEVGTQIDL
jgi:KUP system potassium uptake protein